MGNALWKYVSARLLTPEKAGEIMLSVGARYFEVVAIDADTNPNLATTLGLQPDRAKDITALPRSLLKRETQPDGSMRSTFLRDPMEVLEEYGTKTPDGVRLVVMGAVGHGGAG